jgi:hypothetical protein
MTITRLVVSQTWTADGSTGIELHPASQTTTTAHSWYSTIQLDSGFLRWSSTHRSLDMPPRGDSTSFIIGFQQGIISTAAQHYVRRSRGSDIFNNSSFIDCQCSLSVCSHTNNEQPADCVRCETEAKVFQNAN